MKAVLWDVGGVLVELVDGQDGRARWRDRLGFDERAFDEALWAAIGTRGVLDTPRIVERISARFGLDEPSSERLLWESNDHWRPNRRLIEFAVEHHEGGGRSAIVGNAGAAARWAFEAIVGVGRFTDAVIISAEVGVEKPDPRIYRLAMDALGVSSPAECLFVDDLAANVDGARALGIEARQHTSNEDTIRWLSDRR